MEKMKKTYMGKEKSIHLYLFMFINFESYKTHYNKLYKELNIFIFI